MKIGIFGGSFNPPHKMHEKIAQYLIQNEYIDKVVFVPTGNRYQKQELIDGKYRFQMLELLCSKNSNFLVSDFELKNELMYTYQTLEYFEKSYPDDQIYFILGADNLADIKNWKHADFILKHYHFLAINRGNSKPRLKQAYQKYREQIQFVPLEQDELSSTEIRYWLKAGRREKAQMQLDFLVFDYIVKHQLYQERYSNEFH